MQKKKRTEEEMKSSSLDLICDQCVDLKDVGLKGMSRICSIRSVQSTKYLLDSTVVRKM